MYHQTKQTTNQLIKQSINQSINQSTKYLTPNLNIKTGVLFKKIKILFRTILCCIAKLALFGLTIAILIYNPALIDIIVKLIQEIFVTIKSLFLHIKNKVAQHV